MTELVVRNVEDRIAKNLAQRAAANGVSPEEEHRRILRQVLIGSDVQHSPTDFKDYLRSMPDVGEDSDFSRPPGPMRHVDLAE